MPVEDIIGGKIVIKVNELIMLPTKYKLSVVLLAIVGTSLILLSTNRYGAGLSPDSVGYIGIARNLIASEGLIDYNGALTIIWPPLYPTLLALVSRTLGMDPLSIANIVNALIFGLIVYVGGKVIFKHFSFFPTFALVGTLAILASRPLFIVSVMAWTEPLFILFVLLCFISADRYLLKKDVTSLILFASMVALLPLIRYIGVTLIFWGMLIVVVFHCGNLKSRIGHVSLFTLISALPLGIWLIRNYIISSTLFGTRASSVYTLPQNLTYVFNTLLYWYIPDKIADHRSILIILSAGAGLFAGLSLRDGWGCMKVRLQKISPPVLFAIIYTTFLVISSTTTAYDHIDDRLLSPIYVPLTLLLLSLVQGLVDPYRKRFSEKIVNSFLVIGVVIWLIYPINSIVLNVVNLVSFGLGYSGKAWVDSETVQYLLQHQTLESECTFYTNGPDVTYILAHLVAKPSPAKKHYNSQESVNDISRLRDSWPEENDACLIWFDKIDRTYLFTIDELRGIANIDLIADLADGAVYSIMRK